MRGRLWSKFQEISTLSFQLLVINPCHPAILCWDHPLPSDKMAQPNPYNTAAYTYPFPLTGYENAPPLPEEKAEDGKSYVNPPNDSLSKAYEEFPDPLSNGRRGGLWESSLKLSHTMSISNSSADSDIHIYYFQNNEEQAKHARALWERIRRECQ